jgi:hypothetical protein
VLFCYLQMSESRARRGFRDVSNPYVVPTDAKNTISAYKILEFKTKSFDRSNKRSFGLCQCEPQPTRPSLECGDLSPLCQCEPQPTRPSLECGDLSPLCQCEPQPSRPSLECGDLSPLCQCEPRLTVFTAGIGWLWISVRKRRECLE